VVFDENSSGDGRRYEASKGYFRGVRDAGGLPLGVPYLPEMVDVVLETFDGVLCVGGRYAFPGTWYVGREPPRLPASERLGVERAIVEGCLAHGRPILGICAGMQLLACLNGCRLTPDVQAQHPAALAHDSRDQAHSISLAAGSRLRALVGAPHLMVNSFHREAVATLGGNVTASAHAPDGVIEAIEISGGSFALGVQWHQELFAGEDHGGNAIFRGLVDACGELPLDRRRQADVPACSQE